MTGSTGVQTGTVTVDRPPTRSATSYTPPHTTKSISNFGGEACGGTLFADPAGVVQLRLRPDGHRDHRARRHDHRSRGRSASTPSRRSTCPAPAASVFPTDFTRNLPALAQASIGQNDVQATPLQMALVAAAVANGGTIMKPHVMREVRDSEGTVIQSYGIGPWMTPLSSQTADTMKAAMLDVVARGTATGLQIPGYEVGGKTGTAEVDDTGSRSHAWIMGFAGPPGRPQDRGRRWWC